MDRDFFLFFFLGGLVVFVNCVQVGRFRTNDGSWCGDVIRFDFMSCHLCGLNKGPKEDFLEPFLTSSILVINKNKFYVKKRGIL